MKVPKVFLILISFFVFAACKKDLPKPTQKGANTFGCKIDGLAFTPCNNQYISDPALYGGIDETFDRAFVNANCYSDFPKKSVYFQISSFHGVGEYVFTDSGNVGNYVELHPTVPFYKTYTSISTQTGKVVITKYDPYKHILSGTFEFTAANQENPSEIITITEGRFDLDYSK